MEQKRITTKLHEGVIDSDLATSLYLLMKDSLPWKEGVRSKSGHTRLACNLTADCEIYESLEPVIITALSTCGISGDKMDSCYINYYRDGNDWTPNHTHKDTTQVIISFGATRTLVIGKKEFKVSNGSVAVFGSSVHGVPKDPKCKEGRISMAIFIAK